MSDGSQAAANDGVAAETLVLRLDGFEGPLDLLLELARGQKLDLARISILDLVAQYLEVIEGARRVRLELAADWLVMAAWLAWLKSRLLLPKGAAAEEAELAAEALAGRLRDLQAMRAAAAWLGARAQLGLDVFARGAPEVFDETVHAGIRADIGGLLLAYLAGLRRGRRQPVYVPPRRALWGVTDALARLAVLMGALPDWAVLEAFLPEGLGGALERRAAVASTLLAGLEMARSGVARLRQEAAFGPIMLRRHDGSDSDG